ncbi:MAG: penicillin-binding protein 2 [Candidatus Brocadia sp. AMX2]|uniref:Cell division protein n=1 Tax=Candidatus Brocadia sinica JPN1 TaxID=1197129 RepID=A0ABQ0K1G9_9BACT|nr:MULTISPECIES: penicillin-binding protein 2 [Brocadia]KXK28966.1 MAG: putative glycosyltransferase [Candidatus Brocadia sinica]MBC6932472.1 penicillin-binding protein 2 [Candidatus Brocadia sp.]MBL1168857.1 penicillin-binding protein 2 [Candidatus Brocadia sp. AMX1]KAA0245151.1 MAG: penicillin-binding protein 2 [Candidatus Brocadia sp. AMX2]MCE7866465.1 penicillin-binding protein 2 [Candidatus Brocadia sp. AMX2]
MPLKKHKFWANITGILLIGIFIALAVHLGRIQLVEHDKYLKLAKVQQCKKIELPARRGSILDRNGIKLAESLQVGSVYADPAEIEDASSVAYHLSNVLKLNASKIVKLLGKDKRFVWIKRKVGDEELGAVAKLSLKGVYIKHEYHRFYPNEQLGSHILGFTNIDERGLEGIERSFDNVLSGKPGHKLIVRDALQRQIITPDAEVQLPRHGNDVVLTIDAKIQRITEEELEIAWKKWKPSSATAIVMDPMTGEILAMANYPTFDPNHFKKYSPDARRNLAITDCYEPGSLMKPLVISGVFEQGIARPDDVFFCENGSGKVEGRMLRDTHKYGNLTASEIIAYSSNIGMAKIGTLMGNEKMHRYLQQFNFGERTGIELPGEIGGIFRPLKQWTRKYSLVSISMGHEIAVTPLQFITAFCSIPNGGQLLRPKIVKSTIKNDNQTKEELQYPQPVRRVMSANVARNIMNPILMKVITEGTGKNANLLEYDVAGKTGTSQKIHGEGGRYSHEKYVGSFIAYAPAERPRMCVLVMINEPRNGEYYGGIVAAPVVGEIMRRSLVYLGVEPSGFKMAMQ